MNWSYSFISEILNSVLFGNSDFFKIYEFNKYLESKYRLNKNRIRYMQIFLFTFFLFIIALQFLTVKSLPLGVTFIEILLVIFCIRVINYITFLQFKDYSVNIETIGYFVINELLVILDTSQSLKEATQFVISSNFPVYSNIFRNAMKKAHFGKSLQFFLRKTVTNTLSGDIRSIFLNILTNWENGKNIALVSKNRILNRISEQIMEETDKIDSWASLSSGIIFLCPPVILCFLLITGNMRIHYGILISIGILVGSYFIMPERNLNLFSGNNQLSLSNDRESIEFLVILSENLSKGFPFAKSVINTINTDNNQFYSTKYLEKSKSFIDFKLGVRKEDESDNMFFQDIFSERMNRILLLTKKFSMLSTFIAGEKLLTITKEIGKSNQIMAKGRAQLRAAQFHRNIIQILSLVSLAFITGASPFFIYVSNMISLSFDNSMVIMKNSSLELVYFLIAIVMCISPVRKSRFNDKFDLKKSLGKELLKISKFLIFFIVYLVTNSFLHNYF